MSKIIFNIVPEDIEKPHVSEHVHPPPVKEHGGEEGKYDLPECVLWRALQKGGEVSRNHAKLASRQIRQPRILRPLQPLQNINEDVQPD